MACDFTGHPTIFPNVEMLHNNILGATKKLRCRVDIEDFKNDIMNSKRHLRFKTKCLCMIIIWFVHTGSNPLISKHRKIST
jgi:hypothetical protein